MNIKSIRKLGAAGMAVALTGLSAAAGAWMSGIFAERDPLPLFGLLAGAFLAACLFNRIAVKVFARNHFGLPAEERQKLFEEYDEASRRDPEAALKRFTDMDVVPIFMLVLYFLLTVAMSVAAGMCVAKGSASLPHALVGLLGGIGCAWAAYMPLLRRMELLRDKLNPQYLVPTNYLPILEGMARKAAEAVGIKGAIRLDLSRDCECAVNRVGRVYVVFLGTRLLSALNQEEMYQTLLRTFAYSTHRKEYSRLSRRYRLAMLGSANIRPETCLFDLFYSYADAYVEWEYEPYRTANRRYMDLHVYEYVHKHGDVQTCLQAMAKEAMWPYFVFESTAHITEPFYQEATPHKHHERDVCNAFRCAIHSRGNEWLTYMERQTRKLGDGSSLFREERQKLDPEGICSIQDLRVVDPESPYGEEVLKGIKQIAEVRFYHDIVPDYKTAREREYLEPLRVVEAYEAAPEGYSTPELSPVINAYRDLCRYAEAEALCDAIMERETNPFALAHAVYFKGMCLVHRYETEGVDLIYRAIDLNKNYMHDGFEIVEEYCTLCGLTDEYATYRRRAEIQISAHAYNHEGAGYLLPTDRLEREEDLGDMLPDILGYMEQVADGCIRQIYLVRKVVSEDFFTSAFVVNFEYGIPEEQMRRVYAAIFNYLDAYPVDWQFSLFVYDRQTERAVLRVEGSLVWEKKP